MKETPPMKKKGRKPDVVEVEDRLSPGGGPADGPFPSWRRPSPAECFAARDALALLHGEPGAIPSSPPPSSPRPPPPPPLPSSEAAAALSAAAATFSDPDGCHSDCLSVLDSLVRTILSQNTTDATSARAFRSLKIALPTWEHARTAKVGIMEEAIRVGGLAEIKAARIRTILEIIRTEALEKKRNGGGGGGGEEKKKGGKEKEDDKKKKKKKASDETTAAGFDFNNSLLSLDYLREWPDAEEIKRELVRFNGVGPKTAGELFISFFPSLFISPPPSLSLSHTHTRTNIHTHTHTFFHSSQRQQNASLRRALRAEEGRLPRRHPHPPHRRGARLDAQELDPRAVVRAPQTQGAGDRRPRLARAPRGTREGLHAVHERRERGRGRGGEMRDEARGRGGCRGGEGGGGGVTERRERRRKRPLSKKEMRKKEERTYFSLLRLSDAGSSPGGIGKHRKGNLSRVFFTPPP
jgi:endonuclease III